MHKGPKLLFVAADSSPDRLLFGSTAFTPFHWGGKTTNVPVFLSLPRLSGCIGSVRHDRVLRVSHASQHLLQQAHWHTRMAGRGSHDEKGERLSRHVWDNTKTNRRDGKMSRCWSANSVAAGQHVVVSLITFRSLDRSACRRFVSKLAACPGYKLQGAALLGLLLSLLWVENICSC